VSAIKADALRAFSEAAARAKEEAAPLILLGRAFGCGPAMHVLAHAPLAEVELLTKVCLVSPFTSLLDLAWHLRPSIVAWPVLRYRNSGAETFDNLALAQQFPVPVRLIHGKLDDCFPPHGAEALQAALKDAHLVMRPDWDHYVPWDVLIEKELKKFFTND
jgi:fermentation-respiration switch protein FrsA (DUF1100 family)